MSWAFVPAQVTTGICTCVLEPDFKFFFHVYGVQILRMHHPCYVSTRLVFSFVRHE